MTMLVYPLFQLQICFGCVRFFVSYKVIEFHYYFYKIPYKAHILI